MERRRIRGAGASRASFTTEMWVLEKMDLISSSLVEASIYTFPDCLPMLHYTTYLRISKTSVFLQKFQYLQSFAIEQETSQNIQGMSSSALVLSYEIP